MPFDLRHRSQRGQHLGGDQRGVLRQCDLGQQDQELVPAVAADGVRFAHRSREAARHTFERAVPHRMTEGVVDLLELVQIHKQQRHPRGAAPRVRNGVRKAVQQQGPGRQFGEWIVAG